jgi:cellulose synthase/poly-beta-1,6-N-acetylglucosamine synthase-like glycosyltransferase
MLGLILEVLRWLLLVVEVLVALPIVYLCIISFSAMFYARRRARQLQPQVPFQRFAILIPAHNEEELLGKLLTSLIELDYPPEYFTICVVADNCTDQTAHIARQFADVRVYERANQTQRGKGYALNWLMQQIDSEQLTYDACVILDADSVVQPDFLQAFNRELAQGVQALQAHNAVLNTQDSPSTVMRWIALTLMNHVRPLGRNGLGASGSLSGNGMCLSRSLLQKHPWQAFSLAEDYQYYLSLILDGEVVRYVPEALVRSHMPTTFAQMRTQDVRWEASDPGRSHWRTARDLLQAGIRARDWKRLEAIAELLTPPLSLMVGSCLFILLASLALWSWPLFILACLITLGLLNYVRTAFYFLHPPRSVYLTLLYAPAFLFWKIWVNVVLSRSKKHTSEWVRTSRTAAAEE